MPPKKKPGKKKMSGKGKKGKKLTKKQRAELAKQQALEAEQEALRQAELERIRLENELRQKIKQAKQDTVEQKERIRQLEESFEVVGRIQNYNIDLNRKYTEDVDWDLYVNVGRLPNPVKFDMMTRYLHLWDEAMAETMMEEVVARTKDVLYLLQELDYRINSQRLIDNNEEFIKNLLWLRELFREQQQKMLNFATYNRLRDIEKYFKQLNLYIAEYQFVDENDGNLIVHLWLKINQPTSLPNLRKLQQLMRERQIINFPNLKLSVEFPEGFEFTNKAIRAMYLRYDHLSDTCSTIRQEFKQNFDDKNLFEYVKYEWNEKLKIMPKFPYNEDEGIEPIDEYLEIGDKNFEKLDFSIELESDDVINLRKYRILGGIYYLEYMEQPPQPQKYVHLTMTTTAFQTPKQLEMVDLLLECELPTLPDPDQFSEGILPPEVIDAHLKETEEELNKLILVTLTIEETQMKSCWPTHVQFFELPIICQWDNETNVWTTDNIIDIKHNEEKGLMTFRIGKLGIFGLAAYRYSNLPYQAWEIFPENDGSVTIQITCAIILVEFNVKDDGSIALVLFQNSPNPEILDDLIGERMKISQLILIMQERGIDIFPDCDAICYVEGACEKQWEMERHLYFNMAQLSLIYNFAWSRWNLNCGYKQIILQMREYILDKINIKRNMKKFKPIKQRQFKMLSITTQNAQFVDCTEVSPDWNDQPIDGDNTKFCADLWNLIQWTTNDIKKEKINRTPYELIFNVYQILQRTRICSFS